MSVNRDETLTVNHQEIVRAYQAAEKAGTEQRFALLIDALASAIKAGDFLLLLSLVYKTSKQVDGWPPDVQNTCLGAWYENCALYHFYEHELTTGLKEMEQALGDPSADADELQRRLCYYIAMLIAAHLPQQAEETIVAWAERRPELAKFPAIQVMRVALDVETHQEPPVIQARLREARETLLETNADDARIMRALDAIEAYVAQRGRPDGKPLIFPKDWEQLFRVDLWLEAKHENTFYHDLLIEAEWSRRKKVY